MKFPREKFYEFCRHLTIESKEQGLIKLWPLMGSQQYFVDEVIAGLEQDIHTFIALKFRQGGMSTICLALDLFWQMNYRGMQGSIITDDESNRDYFKSTLEGYLKYLPNSYKIKVVNHNRNQLVFANRSRVNYIIAGTRKKGTMAQGKGINFVHGTETSTWADEDGLRSLMSALAEQNPRRLYLFESTAKGFNMFHDMYQDAKRSKTQKAIFIGWWRKEALSIPKDDKLFKFYWDGVILPEERAWIRDVKRLYDFDITPEQIAWWRWKLETEIRDIKLMMQNFPPTEDHAFILTGDQFFSTDSIYAIKKKAAKRPYQAYRYEVGADFSEMRIHATQEGELKVWEEPVPEAHYVIGADPAYGSSDWADQFVIQVCRCYADHIEQVAEYSSRVGTMYGFAWIICHLAGAYMLENKSRCTCILEINGPGRGVLQELQRLPSLLSGKSFRGSDAAGKKLMALFSSIEHYIYRRPDSMGSGQVWQWQTTPSTKPIMMNNLRDAIERKYLTINSEDWAEEARFVVQEGSSIGGQGRSKDDRVIALALCVQAWMEQIQPTLIGNERYVHREILDDGPQPNAMDGTVNSVVNNYLRGILSGRPN